MLPAVANIKQFSKVTNHLENEKIMFLAAEECSVFDSWKKVKSDGKISYAILQNAI